MRARFGLFFLCRGQHVFSFVFFQTPEWMAKYKASLDSDQSSFRAMLEKQQRDHEAQLKQFQLMMNKKDEQQERLEASLRSQKREHDLEMMQMADKQAHAFETMWGEWARKNMKSGEKDESKGSQAGPKFAEKCESLTQLFGYSFFSFVQSTFSLLLYPFFSPPFNCADSFFLDQ